VFTGPIYGWSGSENGLLMAVLGFASLPLSFLVGLASPHVSDRALTAGALTVTAVGAALCTKAGDDRFGAAYFGGGGMLYMVCRQGLPALRSSTSVLSGSFEYCGSGSDRAQLSACHVLVLGEVDCWG
jgi:hypothetical protein